MKLNKMEAEYFWQAILDHIEAKVSLARKECPEDSKFDDKLKELLKESEDTRERLCNQFAENTGWKPGS